MRDMLDRNREDEADRGGSEHSGWVCERGCISPLQDA
jgi:hypothetical protein